MIIHCVIVLLKAVPTNGCPSYKLMIIKITVDFPGRTVIFMLIYYFLFRTNAIKATIKMPICIKSEYVTYMNTTLLCSISHTNTSFQWKLCGKPRKGQPSAVVILPMLIATKEIFLFNMFSNIFSFFLFTICNIQPAFQVGLLSLDQVIPQQSLSQMP